MHQRTKLDVEKKNIFIQLSMAQQSYESEIIVKSLSLPHSCFGLSSHMSDGCFNWSTGNQTLY